MLSGVCPARFGVLFCSVVPGCRYTPYTTGPCSDSQWCSFLTGGCLSVTLHFDDLWEHCVCCIRSGVTLLDPCSWWCSTYPVCASAGYTQCFGRTSLFIIIKTSSTGPSGKNKIVHKLLSQPHKHLTTENWRAPTQGSNQRLTAPLNPSSIPVSNTVLGRSFHNRTWAGKKALSNCDVLHLDTSNSN